jgi:hypothetical protein
MKLILGMVFFGLSSFTLAADSNLTTTTAVGLIGSVWAGEASSPAEPYRHTYKFSFTENSLAISMTCHVDQTSSMTLSADKTVTYDVAGNVATLISGVFARASLGTQTCSMVFPAALEFHLDGTTIYLIQNGTRQNTQMRRVN